MHLSEKLSFKTRFRIRTLLQNIPSYTVIFVGTLFAVFIMIFGMMFVPIMDSFEAKVTDNMLCNYQYVLKYPAETSQQGAERYCVTGLMTEVGRYGSEEATVYGISEDSDFCSFTTQNGKIMISDAYAKKFQVKQGDKITLSEKFLAKKYTFEVQGVYPYPSTIAVFMGRDDFCESFGNDSGYFNGYLSSERLTDLPEEAVATVVTADDLTKTSRQMRISLGGFMLIFQGFGAVMFTMIIYLLAKLIIDKNSRSVSIVKILGYDDKEINSFYVWGTSVSVALSVAVSLPLANVVMEGIFVEIFASFPGWMTYDLPVAVLVKIGALAMILYGVVLMVQMKKVKRVALGEALKNVE